MFRTADHLKFLAVVMPRGVRYTIPSESHKCYEMLRKSDFVTFRNKSIVSSISDRTFLLPMNKASLVGPLENFDSPEYPRKLSNRFYVTKCYEIRFLVVGPPHYWAPPESGFVTFRYIGRRLPTLSDFGKVDFYDS